MFGFKDHRSSSVGDASTSWSSSDQHLTALLKDEVAGHKNMNGRTYSLAGRDEIIKINQTILLTNQQFGQNWVQVRQLVVHACQLIQNISCSSCYCFTAGCVNFPLEYYHVATMNPVVHQYYTKSCNQLLLLLHLMFSEEVICVG